MLKRIGLGLLLFVILVIVFVFTALNSGTIELNMAFFAGTYSISIVVITTFIVGILFGMLCMMSFVLRIINDRRTLRRALRMSESEVSSLRNLPLSDAD
jgi:uncharacterized membrane protein YciS (DUF1049 family)